MDGAALDEHAHEHHKAHAKQHHTVPVLLYQGGTDQLSRGLHLPFPFLPFPSSHSKLFHDSILYFSI